MATFAEAMAAQQQRQQDEFNRQVNGWYNGTYWSKGVDGFRPRESIHDRDPPYYTD